MGRTDEALRILVDVTEGYRQTFGPTHIQTSSPLSSLLYEYQQLPDDEAIREFCERWLREILATPIDPDPYQRSRRSITLGKLSLELTKLPAPARFDVELVNRAAEEAATVGGGWYGWTMLGAVLCRLGRLDEALHAFQASVQQADWTGGNDFHWFALAATFARRGDLAQASECFERGRPQDIRRDSWGRIVAIYRDEAAALLGVASRQGEVPAKLPD